MSLTFVHTKIKSFCPCGLLLCILSCIIRSAWWSHHKPVPHQSEKGLWKNDLHQAGIWCMWMVQLFQSQGEGSCNPLVALCCWGGDEELLPGKLLVTHHTVCQGKLLDVMFWIPWYLPGSSTEILGKQLSPVTYPWCLLGALLLT